jgi:hypothetical protein
MTTTEIQQKTKFIQRPNGKVSEVILPYKIYQELLEVNASLEIYQQPEVQASLQRAKQDVETNRVKTVQTVDEAIEWLNQ